MIIQRISNRLLINVSKSKLSTIVNNNNGNEAYRKHLKTLKFRTCRNIYSKLRQESSSKFLYKNSPDDGLDISLEYIDTRPVTCDNNNRLKTIVAIHGTADTYQTFIPFIKHFESNENVRLIVPTLPDYSYTRATNFKFWHLSIEKYCVMNDFFRLINVDRIDCFVGHSYGAETIMTFVDNQLSKNDSNNVMTRSIIMLAPQLLLDDGFKLRRFEFISKTLLALSKSALMTNILNSLRIYESKFIPFKFKHVDQLFYLSTIAVDRSAINGMAAKIDRWKSSSIPTYIIFSSDEQIIREKARKKLDKLLEIDPDKTILIDHEDDPQRISQNNLKLINQTDTVIKKLIVTGGKHFPHNKSPNIISYLIEKLINQ